MQTGPGRGYTRDVPIGDTVPIYREMESPAALVAVPGEAGRFALVMGLNSSAN